MLDYLVPPDSTVGWSASKPAEVLRAVTGGFVYAAGLQFTELYGMYVFGDWFTSPEIRQRRDTESFVAAIVLLGRSDHSRATTTKSTARSTPPTTRCRRDHSGLDLTATQRPHCRLGDDWTTPIWPGKTTWGPYIDDTMAYEFNVN